MRPKLVLFGDSITEESFMDSGWGACLAHHFSRSADVVLRGYARYNTRSALKAVDRIVDSVEVPPAAVTVFFGAYDASLPYGASSFLHVPLLEYGKNLRAICAILKERWSSTVVILITPPPVDEVGRLQHPFGDNPAGLPDTTNVAAGAYADTCVAVAEELGIPIINIWARMQEFPGWEKSFLREGLHFTTRGSRVFCDEVIKKLRDEGLSLDTMAVDLPLLCDIDTKDPLKAFCN